MCSSISTQNKIACQESKMKNILLILVLVVTCAVGAPSGKPRFSRGLDKIVGGTDAAPGEIPYIVSFQDISFGYNFHFCGGSIYSENWVLTSASCVDGEVAGHPNYLQIVAGESSLSSAEGSEQVIILKSIIQHEEYDVFSISNDIALLELSSNLVFDEYVQPIALPEQNQDSANSCTASGWGITIEGGSAPDTLQKVTVPIISDEDCRDIYGSTGVYDSMICAGYAEGGRGACQGDTGGPLACSVDGSVYLAGIVSWSYGCARPGFPGVYTEVSHFVQWINSNVG